MNLPLGTSLPFQFALQHYSQVGFINLSVHTSTSELVYEVLHLIQYFKLLLSVWYNLKKILHFAIWYYSVYNGYTAIMTMALFFLDPHGAMPLRQVMQQGPSTLQLLLKEHLPSINGD